MVRLQPIAGSLDVFDAFDVQGISLLLEVELRAKRADCGITKFNDLFDRVVLDRQVHRHGEFQG